MAVDQDKNTTQPTEEVKERENDLGQAENAEHSAGERAGEAREDSMPKRRGRNKRERKKASPDSLFHQVMPIVLVALCAFFGICIYTKIPMGVVGSAIQSVSFGLLGCGAFFLPPMLLLLSLRWHRSVEKQTQGKEVFFGFMVLLLVSVLWYAFGVSEEQMNAFKDFYAMGKGKIGGGFLGNAIGFVFVTLASKIGTVIIAILLLFLCCVFMLDFRPKRFAAIMAERLRTRGEAREEAKMRRAEDKAEAEAEKNDTRFRGDDSVYLAPEVTALSEKSKGGAERDPFMVPGERKALRPITRQLFDVEAEMALLESEKAVSTSDTALREADDVAYDDDLFSDSMPTQADGSTDAEVAVNGVTVTKPSREEETPSADFTVSDDGIPDIPAYRLGGEITDADEAYAEQADGAAGDVTDPLAAIGEEVLSIAAVIAATEDNTERTSQDAENGTETASEEGDGENDFVINKAHVIEHIGAETVGGGEGTFDGRQDSFFHSFPPLSLLQEDTQVSQEDSDQEIKEKSDKLMETLANYGVGAKKSCASRGPRLTRYELIPDKGVRIRAIESLVDEIAMNLEAISVRIEAPIPGKAAVGVEVPNVKYSSVRLRGLLDTDTFRDAQGKTTVCLGVDVIGVPVFADLEKMPHLLVAGATGMGKSVCINSILVSLLYKSRPDEIKLILIDPKKVEFKSYAGIPHLLVPVVTEAQKAAGALSWAVGEMERRYDIIERVGVRNIKAYNKTLADHPEREPLPQIVIVIDELHDLMIQAKDAVEDSIARIAAKARAAGIILIIGTQRPSVNVITGVIKANIPSRIAFHVASQVDSRTILDATGAEKLLNNGDMLFLCPGMQMMTPKRVQGAFLDDDEVNRVAEYLRKNSSRVQYNEEVMADMERESEKYNKDKKSGGELPTGEASGDVGSEEELLYRAIEVALENDKISTSLLQRKLSVGFGKAARMIDRMEEMGIVGPPNGQKPREILISMDEYRAMRLKNDE